MLCGGLSGLGYAHVSHKRSSKLQCKGVHDHACSVSAAAAEIVLFFRLASLHVWQAMLPATSLWRQLLHWVVDLDVKQPKQQHPVCSMQRRKELSIYLGHQPITHFVRCQSGCIGQLMEFE